MRPDLVWLADMREAAAPVSSFLDGYTRDGFLAAAKTRSAVLQQLTVIGEAAARLTPAFRQRYTHIDWVSIIGFRNRAVHAYFAMDWGIVWDTATQNVPALAPQLADIAQQESAGSHAEA